jgi:hypothetical protein
MRKAGSESMAHGVRCFHPITSLCCELPDAGTGAARRNQGTLGVLM